MSSFVVDTRPTPHVLVVVLRFALIEYSCTHSPHDDAEDEESNGEDSIVGCDLFGAVVPSSEVCSHDRNRHNKRDNSDDEKENLWPCLCVVGPWGEVVSFWQCLCSVEDGERGCEHGEDNETAGEVDPSEEDLSNSYSDLHFLPIVSSTSSSRLLL